MRWVGVDVGRTFTDVVVYDEATGALQVGKAPTVPADPTAGLRNALDKLHVVLSDTRRVVHGTTIGTNAILERKGATVWVITTRGFRDTLEIARTNRTILYDIRARKPAPLVPRERPVVGAHGLRRPVLAPAGRPGPGRPASAGRPRPGSRRGASSTATPTPPTSAPPPGPGAPARGSCARRVPSSGVRALPTAV
jgi:hypothetical protein